MGLRRRERVHIVVIIFIILPSEFVNVSFLVEETLKGCLLEGYTHLVNCRWSLRNGSFKEQESIMASLGFGVFTTVLWWVEDPMGPKIRDGKCCTGKPCIKR